MKTELKDDFFAAFVLFFTAIAFGFAVFFTLLALSGCGDNIAPDLDVYDEDRPAVNDIDPGDPAAPPDAATGPDALQCDPGVTWGACADAAVEPECQDSHIDLNGHEHKCRHDQDLPSTP